MLSAFKVESDCKAESAFAPCAAVAYAVEAVVAAVPKPKFVLAAGASNKSDRLLPLSKQPAKPPELPPCTPMVYSTKSVSVVPPVLVAVDSINHQPKKVAFSRIGFNT